MKNKISGIITLVLLLLFNRVPAVFAQDFSLSLYPPLLEVTMMPGKELSQTYLISNQGADTQVIVEVVPFTPWGQTGEVVLNEDAKDPYSSWFSLRSADIKLGEPFNFVSGKTQDIILSINPPAETADGDFYFSLVFSSKPETLTETGNIAQTVGRIASNLLISVSKDGNLNKKAEVKKFSAPRFIDSFSPLIYSVNIENTGAAYFKPSGKIIIDSTFIKNQIINLAPENILYKSSRDLHCLEGESLVTCRAKGKFLLGVYRANLEFNLDSDTKIYKATTETIALPFTLIGSFILIIILLILIKSRISRSGNHNK